MVRATPWRRGLETEAGAAEQGLEGSEKLLPRVRKVCTEDLELRPV